MKKAIIGLVQEMLELYEFELVTIGTKFALKDLQHANLGDIEEERFDTLEDVVDRLWAYHEDYIYRAIEDEDNEWDFLVIDFLESEKTMKLLKEITTEDIIGDEEYKFSAIKEILKTDAQQVREKIRKEVYKRIKYKEERGFSIHNIEEYVFLANAFEAVTQKNLVLFESVCEKLNIDLERLNKMENILGTMWEYQRDKRVEPQKLLCDDFFEILKSI